MCDRCEGWSAEEFGRSVDLAIRVHGWTCVIVGDSNDDQTGWGYTLGLQEHFGHPDLLLVDAAPPIAGHVLAELAGDVSALGEIDPVFAAEGGRTVSVHPRQLDDGLVAQWEAHYQRSAGFGDFVQVIPSACILGHPPGRVRSLQHPTFTTIDHLFAEGCRHTA